MRWQSCLLGFTESLEASCLELVRAYRERILRRATSSKPRALAGGSAFINPTVCRRYGLPTRALAPTSDAQRALSASGVREAARATARGDEKWWQNSSLSSGSSSSWWQGAADDAATMTIPRVIHQFAHLPGEAETVREVKQFEAQMERIHRADSSPERRDGWCIVRWSDADLADVMMHHFPTTIAPVYFRLFPGVQRSDIARYVVVTVYGGACVCRVGCHGASPPLSIPPPLPPRTRRTRADERKKHPWRIETKDERNRIGPVAIGPRGSFRRHHSPAWSRSARRRDARVLARWSGL